MSFLHDSNAPIIDNTDCANTSFVNMTLYKTDTLKY